MQYSAIPSLLLLCGTIGLVSAAPKVTFHKDVEPILMDRCQGCHRPGEIAPMSLIAYKDVRPWAKAIKSAVATRKMPPWFADKAHGNFANDWSLTQTQIDAITNWVDQGAPEGNAKDAPKPKQWVDGWNISKPDLTVEMPDAFPIPAQGKVDYQYLVLPSGLTEDKWVQMAEVRPTFRQAVHHLVVFIREKGSPWLKDAKPGVPYVPPTNQQFQNTLGGGSDILTIYTPGMLPDVFKPGMAKFIPAGADFVLQLHYTTNGKAGADKSRLGVVYAKEQPKERVLTLGAVDLNLQIPPGVPDHQSNARMPVPNEGTLLSFFPHMHLRGKGFEYRLVHPSGEKETLLKVNNYDFNWQLAYRLAKPITMAPGSRIEATGVFDNSANNPANPDPKAAVKWGEQSWEEMMIGFVDLAVDSKFTHRTFMRRPQQPAGAPKPTGGGGEE
jgi:hypothetical protein